MAKLFRTKVCGVKTISDLRAAIDCGVDAIGLNFVPESPRCISVSTASVLAQEVSRTDGGLNREGTATSLVGIFVNATPDYVRQVLREAPLDFVQLHGEELAEDWRHFEEAPLIKAIRWSGDSEQIAYLTTWHQLLGNRLAAFLVDAPSLDVRGGSGMKADWHSLVPRPTVLAGKPLILAGGITPSNVAQAIQSVQPAAVDTASGVEIAPGIKDADKMRHYVQNARVAWNKLR